MKYTGQPSRPCEWLARALPITLIFAVGVEHAAAAGARAHSVPKTLGLTVRRDGTLLRDGEPYRGIGVNYFDPFVRTLKRPNDTSYREGFAELARLGIPFARCLFCGFWPADYKLYLEDKERYFALLDGVVRAAEDSGVGLIPNLFWYSAAVPDLVGEPRGQWGNPKGKTHEFMRTYLKQVVTRYRDSPAIWGWEFGNEYNLGADLPNAAKHRPKIVPQLGTARSRSAHDDLTHDMIATAFAAFAAEVRRHDPHRMITTGNSAPRPSAWHQWKEKSWKQDSENQYHERLLLDNPSPVNTITVHLYWQSAKRFGRQVSIEEFLKLTMDTAAQARKPLFVGEFGAWDRGAEGGQAERTRFARILAAIEKAKAPLAALWVYDFAHQARSWNVTSTNARAYQLDAVAAANRRIRPQK
jgi:hypothetical protein